MIKRSVLVILAFAGLISNAAAAEQWFVDEAKSRLEFVFDQAGSEEKGAFKKFKADLLFTQQDLKTSKFKVEIMVATLTTADGDRDEILLSEDMFNQAKWDKAYFETMSIEHLKDNRYTAKAKLTIRDVTKEIDFPFILNMNKDGKGFELTSQLTLKRLEYGVGQNDWADDKWIADEVKVKVVLITTKINKP